MTDDTVSVLLRFLSHPVTVLVCGILAACSGGAGISLNLLDVDTLRAMGVLRPRNVAFSTGVLAVLGALRARATLDERDRRHAVGFWLGIVGGSLGLVLLLSDWFGLAMKALHR